MTGQVHNTALTQSKDLGVAPDYSTDSGYYGSEETHQRETTAEIVPLCRDSISLAIGQDTAQAQLKYHHDKHEISRSIVEASQIAALFRENATRDDWPMQVPDIKSANIEERPTLVRAAISVSSGMSSKDTAVTRPPLTHTNSSSQVLEGDEAGLHLHDDLNKRPQLQVLRPELMLAAHEANIIHTMDPKAIGSIMEQQFIRVQQHLRSLQVRVEDVSSKVLVTGDLNAGKSTLCNALLRQKLLPVDQQPCTEVFCEILDARENEDRVEVHAVSDSEMYSRDNAATFHRLEHPQLMEAVQAASSYSSLKIYVDDKRLARESLLRNGIVDISLIDGPGLNADSLQTTAVYARQEEIDVVIFVVNAENHFTLSAKQFLWNAANEKAHIFIVVNRFDTIQDKDRCRKIILDQIAQLSPSTYAEAAELVHFVSAGRVLDDDFEDAAFTTLESQLRNFVLDKRSQSKLAPARNFVKKFWSDVQSIATYNITLATRRLEKLQRDVSDVNSKLLALASERQSVLDQVIAQNEASCESVRDYTNRTLTTAVEALPELAIQTSYTGLYHCYSFALKLRDQYLHSILSATIESEMHCRVVTSRGVDAIRSLGSAHLNDSQYKLRPFNVNLMFSRKRDSLQRKLPVDLGFLDFIDMAKIETVIGTSSLSAAMVLYGSRTLGWSTILDSCLRLLHSAGIERSPKILMTCVALFTAGVGYYIAAQVPCALQKNLSKRVLDAIHKSQYVEITANRVATECRKVLYTPETELRLSFASILEAEERSKASLQQRSQAAINGTNFYQKQQALIKREQKRLTCLQL